MESVANDQSKGIAPMLNQPSQALVNSSTTRNIDARKNPPHPEYNNKLIMV